MQKYVFLFVSMIFVAGCSMQNQPIQSNSLSMDFRDMTIEIPSDFKESTIRNNGSLTYWNYNELTAHRNPEDVLITLYKLSSPCSFAITGASQTTDILETGGKTVWGRVDWLDHGFGEVNWEKYPEEPKCRPAGANATGGGYALCSERNNKTILICISQFTKDENMAKSIFKTFKWEID